MDIRLLTEEEQAGMKNRQKALKLSKSVKPDYSTGRHISFIVTSDTGEHNVLYLDERSKDRWQCDCKWYALHNKPCSHIVAVNIALSKKIKYDV